MRKQFIVSLIILLTAGTGFSQTSQIADILNRELRKEVRYQKDDSANYTAERFEVIQPFNITKEGILSVEVRKKSYYGDEYYNEKQEVLLTDITSVGKDINTLLQTELNSVKISRTYIKEDGTAEVKVNYRDLFFLHISHEQENEFLANELVKAFKKAKISIQKNGWYD